MCLWCASGIRLELLTQLLFSSAAGRGQGGVSPSCACKPRPTARQRPEHIKNREANQAGPLVTPRKNKIKYVSEPCYPFMSQNHLRCQKTPTAEECTQKTVSMNQRKTR